MVRVGGLRGRARASILDPLRGELLHRAPRASRRCSTASRCARRAATTSAPRWSRPASATTPRCARAQAAVVARLLPRVRDIRRLGSAALDLAWTAAGRYDAYYEHGVNAWDVAAGEMLCATAGLEVRRLAPLPHTAPGVLVAPVGDRRRARGDRQRMTAPEPRPTARRPGGASAVSRTGSSAPPSHARSCSPSPPISTQAIPPAVLAVPGSAMPGSRSMKNGSDESAIASSTPARRAVSPLRAIVVTGRSRRAACAPTSSTATAHPSSPSGAAATARPSGERGRLGGVGDGEHLEVAAAERQHAVVRADALVAPAAGVGEAVLGGQPRRRPGEVGRRPDDVVDPHSRAAACTSGPVRCAICVDRTM